MRYSSRFTFTLLRPSDEKRVLLDKIPNVLMLVYGWERGPVSGIVHLQGYIELTEPLNIFKLKSILSGYYVEIARESREQNIIYCTKSQVFRKYDPYDLLTNLKSPLYTESNE